MAEAYSSDTPGDGFGGSTLLTLHRERRSVSTGRCAVEEARDPLESNSPLPRRLFPISLWRLIWFLVSRLGLLNPSAAAAAAV